MYLKRLEVKNFKSFGTSKSIPFLEGFTCITGPNGSGKSNIGDAILFVLGPRSSKAIRAGNLTDLIWNGGKEGTPARECVVSLIFDNEDRLLPIDSDEVTFTRRVKVSKSSDNYYSYYYVNGESSSAGEFDELMAHAGMSADGYNIVQQGDVTRIVEMGNLDRRRILDDIAGITQFDADIDKANEERAEVEENLERIGIILDEIDRQLETLKEEKAAAERYRDLKDTLHLEKAKLAAKRKANLEQELAKVEREIASYEEERESLVERLEELQGDVREAQGELEGIEEEIAEKGGEEARKLKERIDELKQDIVRHTERVNYSRTEIQEIKKERAAVEEDLRRVEKQLGEVQEEREEQGNRLQELRGDLEERTDELETLRDDVSQSTGRVGELQRDLAQLKQRYEEKQKALHEAKLEADRLADKRDRLSIRVSEVEDRVETQEFELKDLEWSLKELRKESGSGESTVEELEQELLEKKKEESELTEEIKELEPAIRSLQNKYGQLKAEQEASENMARGYTRAVQAIIEARDRGELEGICGTIAELATVPSKYETALEITAGGRLQAVITETDADAAQAIEYLKRKNVGRVTFLPLSKINPRKPRGKAHLAARDDDSEGFALDLVEFDDKYRPAFWYVLRDTVIVRDLDTARRLMGGVQMVTLDGEKIDAGGAMTGGSSNRSRRLKFGQQRKDELEKAAKELRAAKAHHEQLGERLTELRDEIRDVEEELRDARASTESKEEKLEELEATRGEVEGKLEQFRNELEEAQSDLEDAETKLTTTQEQVADLKSHLEDLDEEREAKNKALHQAMQKDEAQELQRLEAEVADLREEVRDAEGQVETVEQRIELVEERRDELQGKLESIAEEREEHETAIEEHTELRESLQEDLDELLAVEAEQDEELQELRDRRDRVYQRKTELESRCGKVSDKIDTTDDLIVGLRTRIPTIEDKLAEASFELDGYDVELPDVIEESQDDLRSEVRSLDREIESLGDVNMRAIEEWERQSERKEELTTELERLEEQRDNLVELVEEIVERKTGRFMEVFDEINENFQRVFSRLSDGGKARLELEHPDDPFEGGLIMKSQPKGKKVTRLEALSGGEKSLTSMAFIFAIQEYEPSPFYYLDEVDQNLDGVNSELLARMIKANSRQSQVIMVSLRKVSLKESDHVYGVTMTDSGVSEVLGEVNIEEIVHEETDATAEVPA